MTLLSRIGKLRADMATAGIDAVAVSFGSDLPYLTGYRATPSERLTMAVVTADEAVLILPELEAPRVDRDACPVPVVSWSETDDPLDIVTRQLGKAGRVGVASELWARFLLPMSRRLPSAQFEDAGPLLAGLRVIKSPHEIDRLRAAASVADRVAVWLADQRFSGRSERDLAKAIGDKLLDEGSDSVEFTIVASGPNGASPHHDPGPRIIEPGDVAVCDFGGSLDGYQSDTTRTFQVGSAPPEAREAYEVLRRAQRAGIDAVQPGLLCADVDRAARDVISEAGYGDFFIHRTGHGIGLDVHEEPYLIEGSNVPLAAGMAFSIEPGIYIPGRFGMRIEDIVWVTHDGAERLNRSPRRLIEVG